MATPDILAIIFATISLAGVVYGGINRSQLKLGIGTQFIRYNAIVLSLPIAAALAIQGMLTEAAVSIITGALAYAFAGGFGRGER